MQNIDKKETRKEYVESERKSNTVIMSELTIVEISAKLIVEKSGQKISPPKKRVPKLGEIRKTPSIDKAGKQIFMSHEILEDPDSFDFGDLSSVSDEENDKTVLNQNETIGNIG